MKKVFVCSPYSGDIEENTKRAASYCRKEIMDGNVPFAPHLLYPQILDEHNPEERKLGISLGLEMMKHCDELRVCGGSITEGMLIEIQYWCADLGRGPVRFKDTELNFKRADV